MARDVNVSFRIRGHERDALHAAADQAGLKLSEWLRAVALAAAGEAPLVRDLERAQKQGAKLRRRSR